jgi:hypothetical protein|tara:strand:+ start:5539 stop:5970 length:432 start_codon:yes stop_codon:yes gene_type:complete
MKKSELKMMIREVVREEIRAGLKDIIGELKQPAQIKTTEGVGVRRNTKPPKPKKQKLSNNPVLNEVLNETAADEWETMGGTKYTSDRMGELVGSSYKNLMDDESGNPTPGVIVDGQTPDFLKKDYRAVMAAIDKKNQQKNGAQ